MAFKILNICALTITFLMIISVSTCAFVPAARPRPTPPRPAPRMPSPPPTPPRAPSPPPSKYAIIALQWPMGLCKTSECIDGKILPGDRFTLHGVWPVRADGSIITNCEGGEKFSYTALKKLPLIKSVWPSFRMPMEKDFWEHQWVKHGTCAELEFLDYFERSLTLAKRYNSALFKALEQNGISPSSVIDMNKAPLVQKYFNDIVASLNLVPRIKCTTTPDSNVYLLEIHLCAEFDLNKFKNCSVQELSSSYIGCGWYGQRTTNKALYYLDPKKKLVYQNRLYMFS